MLSNISTWEFLRTLEKCEKHSAGPRASLCTSLVFLKIPACLYNSTMHLDAFLISLLAPRFIFIIKANKIGNSCPDSIARINHYPQTFELPFRMTKDYHSWRKLVHGATLYNVVTEMDTPKLEIRWATGTHFCILYYSVLHLLRNQSSSKP